MDPGRERAAVGEQVIDARRRPGVDHVGIAPKIEARRQLPGALLGARHHTITTGKRVAGVAVEVIHGRERVRPRLGRVLRIARSRILRVHPGAGRAACRYRGQTQPNHRDATGNERLYLVAEPRLVVDVDEAQILSVWLQRRVIELARAEHHRHHEAGQIRRASIVERQPAALRERRVEPVVDRCRATVRRAAIRGSTRAGMAPARAGVACAARAGMARSRACSNPALSRAGIADTALFRASDGASRFVLRQQLIAEPAGTGGQSSDDYEYTAHPTHNGHTDQTTSPRQAPM